MSLAELLTRITAAAKERTEREEAEWRELVAAVAADPVGHVDPEAVLAVCDATGHAPEEFAAAVEVHADRVRWAAAESEAAAAFRANRKASDALAGIEARHDRELVELKERHAAERRPVAAKAECAAIEARDAQAAADAGRRRLIETAAPWLKARHLKAVAAERAAARGLERTQADRQNAEMAHLIVMADQALAAAQAEHHRATAEVAEAYSALLVP